MVCIDNNTYANYLKKKYLENKDLKISYNNKPFLDSIRENENIKVLWNHKDIRFQEIFKEILNLKHNEIDYHKKVKINNLWNTNDTGFIEILKEIKRLKYNMKASKMR